jgi:DNA-binding LytR/AlgR family response regulator
MEGMFIDLENLDLALWDPITSRAIAFKDRLDMFAGDAGTTMIPTVVKETIRTHDAVFLSFDECEEPVLKVARTVRESGEMTFILLVNDRTRDLSPLFRPKIRPSGVLFRPVQNTDIRDVLIEIAGELDRITHSKKEELFIFKADGATRRLPLLDILFFEASSKKVLIHTKGQEIAYYDSIENLTASLPSYFLRCHRSFIVNIHKIKELRGKAMELCLTSGERIPFSRSYRESVKQAIYNAAMPEYEHDLPDVAW